MWQVLYESIIDACVVGNRYDFPCIWDDNVEGSTHEEGLIEELSVFTVLEVKDMCEKRWSNEKSMEFDKEDGTIMEPIANMVEECYLF